MNSDQFSVKKQILFAASVSLLNPHAILDTIGVIGTNSLQYDGLEKVAFSVTCIAVSWIWFLSLAITGRTAGKLDQSGKFMLVVNKISAIIIWCIAIYLIKGILKG
jgi:L-lysine exporter family protein LysE/ArgO